MEKTIYVGKRQSWVDIAKGIAIIAVVIGHIGFKWHDTELLPLNDLLVWLWHVPVFFMIGGFFLKDEKLIKPKPFIWGKVKSLYLLILYIYIPILLLHNLFIRIGFYDVNTEYYGKFVSLWGVTDFGKHLLAAVFFAGREPLLGAMWFVYVLFMALCIISVTSWILKSVGKKWDTNTYEIVRCMCFFLFAVLSCTLTRSFNFTIPRMNNTFVAVWLIYIGMFIVQKIQLRFDNGIVALLCAIIAWHLAVYQGGVSLVANKFNDVIVLSASSLACLYVVCYISKIIDKSRWMSRLFSNIGKESFYIMAFHFIGFKVGTLLINIFGFGINLSDLLPRIGRNFLLFIYYSLFGVCVPLLIIYIFRFFKSLIWRK